LSRPSSRFERTLALEASPASILEFEDFVDALDFLSPGERDRLKLAGGEILDNIVKHAPPMKSSEVRSRASRSGGTILLAFYFRSPGFADFAAGYIESEPLYDPAHRRWRGIGLVMCRNLAKRVVFRPGECMDRIFLEFDPQ
jgi:anti-sigma regulatory factor (Ser/Thr protein kinase)